MVNLKIEYDDKELRRIIKNLQRLNSVEVRYGWWDIAKYPRRHRAKGLPVAQIAFWNEFGTRGKNGKSHIPPRPYLTQTGNMLKHILRSDIIKYFRSAIYSQRFTTAALDGVAAKVHSTFEAIVGTGKPLSERTVELKGHSAHWLETGRLLKNFQAKVMRAKKEN